MRIHDTEMHPLGLVDLAASTAGGLVLWSSDEFFADASNLLEPKAAVFDPDRYTDRGKWMDGWESRRRRSPGHDSAIIELGISGCVRMFNINTAHFTGNYPAFARVWGCYAPTAKLTDLRTKTKWIDLGPSVALKGGSSNWITCRYEGELTHLKLDIYPAGGVARLRAYGDAARSDTRRQVNLIGEETGARAIACSDMYFSEMHNLLKSTPAKDMGDGWETKRSRPPGDDWVVIQLGHLGCPKTLVIDTAYFKGNYPQCFAVDAILWPDAEPWGLLTDALWEEYIGKTKLGPDQVHEFPWPGDKPISHLRIRIYPDGGISRVKLLGKWAHSTDSDIDELNWFNQLDEHTRHVHFETCCGATRWVDAMVNAGPFLSFGHLHGEMQATWWRLDESDWLEAFTHHPKIGEDKAVLRAKFGGTAALSADEQSGIDDASEAVIEALAQQNKHYLETFGFIYIVCARGKSASEMLHGLRERLPNAYQDEIRIAAGEQAKISWLRMKKILESKGS